MVSQGVVSVLPGFFSAGNSQDVMTVTVTCNYVDFFPCKSPGWISVYFSKHLSSLFHPAQVTPLD